MTKDVLAILTALVTTIIVFTLFAGGQISMGTAKAGPFFTLGYKGGSAK